MACGIPFIGGRVLDLRQILKEPDSEKGLSKFTLNILFDRKDLKNQRMAVLENLKNSIF